MEVDWTMGGELEEETVVDSGLNEGCDEGLDVTISICEG